MAAVEDADLPKIKPAHLAHQHDKWINAIALSRDGNLIVSGGADRTTRVFSVPNGSPPPPADGVHPHPGTVYDVSLAGATLACATSAGTIRVTSPPASPTALFSAEASGEKAWASRLSRDGLRLAWVIGQTATVTDLAAGKPLIRHRSKHGVASICVTDDAATVFLLKKHALDGDSFFVDVWSTARNVISSTLFDITGGYWPAIACDADGGRLAIADAQSLRVLRPRAGRMATLAQYAAPARVCAVDVTRDGERVVAAVAGGDFGVWDADRQAKVAVLRCPLAGVPVGSSPCAVADDGATVAAGCLDNCVRVWKMEPTRRVVMEGRLCKRFRAAARGQQADGGLLSLEEAKVEMIAFLTTTPGLTAVAGDEVEDAFFDVADADAEQVSERVLVLMFRRLLKRQQESYASKILAIEERRKRRVVAEMVSDHAERFRNRASPGTVLSVRMAARIIGNVKSEKQAKDQDSHKVLDGKQSTEIVLDQLRQLFGDDVDCIDETMFVKAVKNLVYEDPL